MKNEFNTALKEIRKKKGITQEQLADAVGVSAQAVSKWEMNGYPDASLLPVIADFLEVTIDELFGNPIDKADTLNEVVKYIMEKPYKERLQYGMYVCRAIGLGMTNTEEGYWGITDNAFNDPNLDLYSEFTSAEGFFQSRLCESLQYFLIMPEPKNGYDDVLKYDEKYVKLFKFLGKPDVLRAMYYLAGISGWVYVNVGSLANSLNISVERSKEILEEMAELGLVSCRRLNSERGEEKIYQSDLENNFVSFMTFCRTMLNLPCSFNNQSNNRERKAFFKNNTQTNKPEKEK
ncbi:MAG: helix-turn-helix domain-containing protein [Ruminococcaceae bacterium]|nr:helix-turn-helix domain-containing protein [Oscillospiraceae bacterium]